MIDGYYWRVWVTSSFLLFKVIATPRGEFYTEENVKQKLAMRNFMEEMRSAGEITGGPKSFAQKDRQQFANALDRFLTQHVKR